MSLPHYQYRDPLNVLMAREAISCKGCRHEVCYRVWGETVRICARGKRHGRRCRSYYTVRA